MKTERIELKDSGVTFNAGDHTYLLGEKYLSGITPVIQRQLYPDEFNDVPAEALEQAAAYGTSVHKSCEDFDARWKNDGTIEVQDYIRICQDYGLTHEASEYTVTDGKDYASQIDKVYRVSDNTFNLGDIKTYGELDAGKLEKSRWQLSIYAYLFELQNHEAKVGRLFIIHLRNKQKRDGTFDHIAEIVSVHRIPSDICRELLETDLRGEQFKNPLEIPEKYRLQEATIRELIQKKTEIEEQLSEIKGCILRDMEASDVRTWKTDSMRITRKLPTTRTTFNLPQFRIDHPELDYESYMRVTEVAGSLSIAV